MGHQQLWKPSQLLLQKLREQVRVFQCKWKQNPLGNQPTAEVELLHQTGYRFHFFIRFREHFIFFIQKISTGKMKNSKAGFRLRLTIANDIGVRQCSGCYQLLLAQILYRLQSIPETGGKLKLQIFRGTKHLTPNFICHRFVIPPQQFPGLRHGLTVFGAGLSLLAPSGALIHVIIQAGPPLPYIPGKLQMTAGELQSQAKGFHHVMGDTSAAKRAEILRAIVTEPAHQGDSGIDLPHIQPQIGIALVILQQDIVLRHIALDQGAFQYQRFKLRRRDNDIKMMDFTHHDTGFGRMGRGVLKILTDTVLEFLRFADVDYFVGLIPHDIDTRCIGQTQRFFLQLIECHARIPFPWK